MGKIKVYFMEIIDLNGGKHQIKSTDYQKIWDFVKRNKGSIRNVYSGDKLVSENRLKELQKEENFK